MKRLINKTENMAKEMFRGIQLAYPQISYHENEGFFTTNSFRRNKVSIIASGGVGHEPAYAEFIGDGLLDGAVLGNIFSSPSSAQIIQATRSVPNKQGVLIITENFSRHKENLFTATEVLSKNNIAVRTIVVADDIATENSLYSVGRRGSAGTFFVYKVAGAAAAKGYSLDKTYSLAKRASKNIRTLNFALESFDTPGDNLPSFQLKTNEIEYGIGIHGEPGIRRMIMPTADELADILVGDVLRDLGVSIKTELAVIVNGFGSTTNMELYIFADSIDGALKKRNMKCFKTYVGSYFTSLNMSGASVSILKLDNELKEMLAYPCDSPAFKIIEFYPNQFHSKQYNNHCSYDPADPALRTIVDNQISYSNIIYMLDTMSNSIIRNELFFYDLGFKELITTLAMAFRDIRQRWDSILLENDNTSAFLNACSLILIEQNESMLCSIWSFGLMWLSISSKDKEFLLLEDFISILDKPVSSTMIRRYPFLKNKYLMRSIEPIFAYVKKSLKKSHKQGESLLTALKKSIDYCKKILNISLFGVDVRYGGPNENLTIEDLITYLIIVVVNDVLDSMV